MRKASTCAPSFVWSGQMTGDTPFQMNLSMLLADRAQSDYRIPTHELDRVAELITSHTPIDSSRAQALMWGQPAELDATEIDALATLFSLHESLLSLVLSPHPASREVVFFILADISENNLNDTECYVCEQLADRIDFLRESPAVDVEEMFDLCYELLGHLRSFTEEEDEHTPASEEDSFGAAAEDKTLEQLLDVASSLRPDARKRVLVYAYRELVKLVEEEAGPQPLLEVDAYAKLRQSLKPLPRRVFDLVAQCEPAQASAREVIEALSLSGLRALSQLDKSVESVIADLAASGITFEQTPLVVQRGAGAEKQIRMSAEASAAWKALLAAEAAASAIEL